MEFAGYQTRESVARLRNANELQKMFDFVVEMADVINDKNIFGGIFEFKPDKVRVLPGLEPVFKRFLDEVEGKERPMVLERHNAKQNKNASKEQKQREEVTISTESLTTHLKNWCRKRGFDGDPKIKMERIPPNKYIYSCICNEKIVLATSNKSVSLSNAQRHIKDVCWMSERKASVKKNKISTPIEGFLQMPTEKSRDSSLTSIQPLSTISAKHTSPNVSNNHLGSPAVQPKFPTTGNEDLALDSLVSPSDQSTYDPFEDDIHLTIDVSDDEDSKNLRVPAGIHEHIDASGHC